MFYVALGWCAVALALIGVVTPGVPTTVFVLGAAYCFSRSSPRFERWLHENRWLGPSLRRVRRDGGMPRSAKRAALAAMWTAILLSSVVLSAIHWSAAAGTVALGVAGTLSILYGVRTVPENANADGSRGVSFGRATR
jgi:uncharacterized membrane protein YbaN (DUF454 family)